MVGLLLENPGLIEDEVIESFRAIERAFQQGDLDPDQLHGSAGAESEIESCDWFYEGRDLSVLGDSCSFTCLASRVEPLPRSNREGSCEGFDYVGLTCDSTPTPVLGTVQSDVDSSAYLLLLRGLAGLVELAPFQQLERLNRERLKGLLRSGMSFDLTLVTWEFFEEEERTPISQFTRDIAELVKLAISKRASFPFVLRDVVCLRMNPDRFDGRMRFDWRV